MKFNLINPSDPYTFEADDLEIAAVVVCLLGNGKYAADPIGADADPKNRVPAFLFSGHDEWFKERFGVEYYDSATRCFEDRNDAVARAFESVSLNGAKRSSMNNIGGRARQMAKDIRAAHARKMAAQGHQAEASETPA